MPAKFLELIGASSQRRDERQPWNAAPAPLPHSGLVEANNNSRSMVSARDARRDDPEHARDASSRSPRTIAAAFAKFPSAILASAAWTISRSTFCRSRFCPSKSAGQRARFGCISSKKKAQRFLGSR